MLLEIDVIEMNNNEKIRFFFALLSMFAGTGGFPVTSAILTVLEFCNRYPHFPVDGALHYCGKYYK